MSLMVINPFWFEDVPSTPGQSLTPTKNIYGFGPGIWTWFCSPEVISLGTNRIAATMVDSEPSDPNNAGTRLVEIDLSNNTFKSLNSSDLGLPGSGGFDTEKDDHNNGSLVTLPNGKIGWMIAGHPTNSLYLGISANSNDPTSIASINNLDASLGTANYTYCNTYVLNGAVYQFGRDGTTPGGWYWTKSTDNGQTWLARERFVVGTSGYSPYLVFEPDGTKLHFIVTDGHPRDVSNSVYHGYFDATTDTFHQTDGTAVAISPVPNPSAWSLAYDGSTTNAWVWDVKLSGTNIYALISTYGGGTDSAEYRRLFFNGTSWSDEIIWEPMGYIYSGTAEEHYVGGLCFDPSSVDTVWAAVGQTFQKGGDLRKFIRQGASDWDQEFITGGDYRGSWDEARVGRPTRVSSPDGIAFWSGDYPSFTNFTTVAGFFKTDISTRKAGLVSARAWRLRVLNTGNIVDNTQIADIEFRQTIGGVDFTDAGPGSAISSSVFNNRSDLQPEFAFNGSTSDRWAAQGTYDQWIGWDAGAGNSFAVAEVVMTEFPGIQSSRPTMCLLEYSNDLTTWTKYAFVPGNEPRASFFHDDNTRTYQVFDCQDIFTPAATDGSYRFIKVCLLAGSYENLSTRPVMSVMEYMTIRDSGGVNLINTSTGSGHATDSGPSNPISNLWVDDTTLWFSDEPHLGIHHIMWDFGEGNSHMPADVQIRCRSSGSPLRIPQSLMIMGSNNGITWDTLHFVEGLTWTTGETKTFDLTQPTQNVSLIASLRAKMAAGFATGTTAFSIPWDAAIFDDNWGWTPGGDIICPPGTKYIVVTAFGYTLGGSFHVAIMRLKLNGNIFAVQQMDNQFRNGVNLTGAHPASAGDIITSEYELPEASRTFNHDLSYISVRAYG